MIEYLDYAKFKKKYKIKRYMFSVVVNLSRYYNFIHIGEGERDYDLTEGKYTESNLDYAKRYAEARNIKSGLVVYYRTKDKFGLPYLIVLYHSKPKDLDKHKRLTELFKRGEE